VDIISVILPIALAISAAFAYQQFNESNQLIALQAAGLSPIKALNPLMRAILITVAYLYVGNAYISPDAWRKFRSLEFEIKNNIDSPEKTGVIFSNNGFSVYAQEYAGNFFFKNLFITDARNPEKTHSYFARSGTIRNNVLMLTEGERIEIDFTNHKNSIMRFKSYNYDLKEILKAKRNSPQPNEKFVDELLREDGDVSTKALLHQKITSPLLAIIFPLLSFLLVLLAPYARRRSSWKIILLTAVVIMFQGGYFWIANAAGNNLEFAKLNYILIVSSIVIIAASIYRRLQNE
jgi:lipopolysaccharide export system permease protein